MTHIVDSATANGLIAQCRAACEAILKEAGFEMTKTSGKYGDSLGFSLTAVPSVKDENGLNPNAPEVVDFKRYHQLYDLPANALGLPFTVGRDQYKFLGLQMSRKKYPLLVEKNGKKVLLTTDAIVIEAIKRAAA